MNIEYVFLIGGWLEKPGFSAYIYYLHIHWLSEILFEVKVPGTQYTNTVCNQTYITYVHVYTLQGKSWILKFLPFVFPKSYLYKQPYIRIYVQITEKVHFKAHIMRNILLEGEFKVDKVTGKESCLMYSPKRKVYGLDQRVK